MYPIYEAASDVSRWLAAYGYSYDIVMNTADTDGNGDLSAYDASLVLRWSIGLTSMAPASGGSIARKCRLSVNNCDDGGVDISIDVDDLQGVYSADVVLTYDPRALRVSSATDKSGVPEWLFAYGEASSGKLRMSLAGASQAASDGSLVAVRFEPSSIGHPASGIKSLEITEFKLNGGMLKSTIENLPKTFALLQNYPNPFNPETWIPYQLSEPANVNITIYSISGQVVRRLELGSQMPGRYVDRSRAAYWDGRNQSGEQVASGTYFYQLQTDRDSSVRKLIVVK